MNAYAQGGGHEDLASRLKIDTAVDQKILLIGLVIYQLLVFMETMMEVGLMNALL